MSSAPHDPVAVRELADGIEAGELRPWYQPVVRLDTRELVGFEALARWHRGWGEIQAPLTFIDLAERSGLVGRLDLAIMDRAVTDLADWQELRPELRMAINVSGRHLDSPAWLEQLHLTVADRGIAAASLDLELTETMRPGDFERCLPVVEEARARGYAVWLDDFGTGWTQLRHLVDMPLDGIKIDRFFVRAAGPRADVVITALLDLAQRLGLRTVAEGIASAEDADRFAALGCDLGQGYYWSRPIPPDEVAALLDSADPVLRL
jgi:EAL domain-containing protein (putative c-di-GMP-specific phosphodiesterase class I)